MASTVNVGGIIPMDTHICGGCRTEFDDIHIFINHKKQCHISTSISLRNDELLLTESEPDASLKSFRSRSRNCISHDNTVRVKENVSEPHEDTSMHHYVWQPDEYNNVSDSDQAISFVETAQIDNTELMSLSNNSCQPENSSSHPSSSSLKTASHELTWQQFNSTDSFVHQSQVSNEFNINVSNSVPGVFEFAKAEERSNSTSDHFNKSDHDLEESVRPKEVLSIDAYRNVPEQTNLLDSVETASLNTIDNSTPCPEDLEVGQISAAMLGKLSKKFSSKFYHGKTHTALENDSVESDSASTHHNFSNATATNERKESTKNVNSVKSKEEDTSFIMYRNINTASAPLSEKSNLNPKERRERLPGVSDELLTSSPMNSKHNNGESNIANYRKAVTQRNIDTALVVSAQRELKSISPPMLTSYKAVFTSPSSAGHRLAPDVNSPEKDSPECSLTSNNLVSMKGNLIHTSTGDAAIRRDTKTTSYKDISKLIKNSHNSQTPPIHGQFSLGSDTDIANSNLEKSSASYKNISCDEPFTGNCEKDHLSSTSEIQCSLESGALNEAEILTRDKMVSVELVEPSDKSNKPREASNHIEGTVVNSCLPLSSAGGWSTVEVCQESILSSSGSHHSLLGNEMIINGETVTLTHQPGQTKGSDSIVMVIKDTGNNLVMMYPPSKQEEVISDNQLISSSSKDVGASQEGDKRVHDLHLLFQPETHHELLQTQDSFYCSETQLQQPQQQQQPSTEYHFIEKVEPSSNTTSGYSESAEFFRLTSSGENQTCSIAPIQIIAVENTPGNDSLCTKSQSFHYAPVASNEKNLVALDSRIMKTFHNHTVDAKKSFIHSSSDKNAFLARKHRKHLKKQKASSTRVKSFLSPLKANKDGGGSTRNSHDVRARKVVSMTGSNSQNYVSPMDGLEMIKGSKSTERSFICKFGSCSYKTNLYKDFQRHYRTHTGEKPFKCTICGRTFNRSDKLKTHVRWHNGQKPFQCKLCDYAAIESGSLKKHMRIHNDERPFQCQICPYASRNSSQLVVHLRTHTGDSPFHCNVCSAQFKINSDLKRHMRIHTGEKPFKCDKCDYRSSNKANLKTHYRINHSHENEKKCPYCAFVSSSLKRIREHIKTHDSARVIKCTVCQYTCNNATALRSHMTVHNSDKPFSCSVCQYACKQSGNLKKHMQNVHGHGDKVKIFLDPAASKQTVTHVGSRKRAKPMDNGSVCQRRKRSTNCRKMYMCNKCDCGFVRQDSLRCHLKHHREEGVEKDGSSHSAVEVTSMSQEATTKPSPPVLVKHRGLDHIVAAASQMYQEQYMSSNREENLQSSGCETVTINPLTQMSSNSLHFHGENSAGLAVNNVLSGLIRKDMNQNQPINHQQVDETKHTSQPSLSSDTSKLTPMRSHSQPGVVPWEHSCYTLSTSKSRKQPHSTSSSTHQTSLSSMSSLISTAVSGQYESSNLDSHQSALQLCPQKGFISTHSQMYLDPRNTSAIAPSDSGAIIIKPEAETASVTGTETEPFSILSGQPMSTDIHLLVHRNQIPVSNFASSHQPAQVVMAQAQETLDMGGSDLQNQTVTFQVLPQVATINQPNSHVATLTQDLSGQLALQTAPSLAPTHGTPIQISFPTGTQFAPQGTTLMTQPQIMFQLTGTNRSIQNGQEVISISTEPAANIANSTFANQTSQIVLGHCSSYGQPQQQMVTIPFDMSSLTCIQKKDAPMETGEAT